MIHVLGYGPSTARFALVGEAPGGDEENQGIPFVGSSGKIVDSCLEFAGVKRSDVYLTNVCKVRPPNNDIKKLHLRGYELKDFIPQFEEEIKALNPNCILAIGATALNALTGNSGIEKFRGSILKSHLGPKVVGTIHPAAILHSESENSKMRSWKDLTYIKWDFARAYEESKTPLFDPPRRNLIVCRSNLDLYRFLNRNVDRNIVSVDIETFRTIPICIGLAFSSDEAISVPLFNQLTFQNQEGMTRSDLLSCWKDIADLSANPRIRKIGQNFKFDERQLEDCVNGTLFFGMKVNSFWFDTLLAFRILYNELPGRLEFITSVLTKEPYYKEEGKGFNPKRDKLDRLLLYNAKDAAVTYECFERELSELRERNLEEFFFTKVMPLHPFYSRMESRGIKRDNFQQKFLKEKYEDEFKTLQKELEDIALPFTGGRSLNVNSNGTKGDMPWLVFLCLNLPARAKTDEKTLDALMRNHCSTDPIKHRILELVLKIRKVRKTIGTYIEAEVDHRGRLCTSVRIILETGRTSTNILKSPVTTHPMGWAMQTVTKHGETGTDIRSMCVPDPGYVFLEPDQSGAEARVVAILARDEKLLKIFEYGLDLHRITYAWIKGIGPNELIEEFYKETDELKIRELAKEINKILKGLINDEDRQLGKKFRHAANYDMGKRVASENAGCSEWRANQILTRVHSTNSNIRGVYHKEIQEALRINRELINPFGRPRIFLNKWGDELFKEAYAQIPQSTVSDQTKYASIRIEKRLSFIQILGESHDAILCQVPISKVDESIRVIKEEFEQPIDFKNCTLKRGILTIPCEIKIGKKNWELMEKIA